jgi:uncharacterized membrane protein (UPF0127 family)
MIRALAIACWMVMATPALAAPVLVNASITTAQGEIPLTLEAAFDDDSRATGLMHRRTLAPHDGMIFLFPDTSERSFWMKNTLIPLDMLFVAADGTIAQIEHNAVPHSLQARRSYHPVNAVIELAGGRAATQGIKEGDRVRYAIPATLTVR